MTFYQNILVLLLAGAMAISWWASLLLQQHYAWLQLWNTISFWSLLNSCYLTLLSSRFQIALCTFANMNMYKLTWFLWIKCGLYHILAASFRLFCMLLTFHHIAINLVLVSVNAMIAIIKLIKTNHLQLKVFCSSKLHICSTVKLIDLTFFYIPLF